MTDIMPLGESKTRLDYDRKSEQLIVNALIYLKDKGDLDVKMDDNNHRLNQLRKHTNLRLQRREEYIDNAKKENGESQAPAFKR